MGWGGAGGVAAEAAILPSPFGRGAGGEGAPGCAFLLDIAGQEETHTSSLQALAGAFELDLNDSRDAVTLRIVEIDLSTLEALQLPTYRVIYT